MKSRTAGVVWLLVLAILAIFAIQTAAQGNLAGRWNLIAPFDGRSNSLVVSVTGQMVTGTYTDASGGTCPATGILSPGTGYPVTINVKCEGWAFQLNGSFQPDGSIYGWYALYTVTYLSPFTNQPMAITGHFRAVRP